MVDLSVITKNPAHMAIAAGAVVLAVSVISKGKQVAGVKKKTVQLGGGVLIVGGLVYKYLLKKGNNGGNGTGPIVLPTMPSGTPIPVAQSAPVLPQLPGSTTAGPTTGPGAFPGPVLSNYSRSRISTAARKANFANQNTLGVFYNDVAT